MSESFFREDCKEIIRLTHIGKYTEESLVKYSIAAGIAFIVFAAYEVFILLNKLKVINVLSSIEDSYVRMLITVVSIGVILILNSGLIYDTGTAEIH